MIPGQLGPTKRVFDCDLRISVMRTISETYEYNNLGYRFEKLTMLRNTLGDTVPMLANVKLSMSCCQENNIPYYQWEFSSNGFLNTSRGDMRSDVGQRTEIQPRCQIRAYGTKMADAVAPASFIACSTVANTGSPRCVCPAFLGFVPPTTFVPG
jgi:hypothetical protein